MLTTIGASLPARERLHAIGQGTQAGVSLISLLNSCRLSLAGIVVTVSTPLATAIRFSTGKIEMTITNTSSQQWPWKTLPAAAKNQLSLDGRVEIDLNLALGYLHNVGPDVVDDLMELAYFRTRISVRNTLQNLPANSDITEGDEGEGHSTAAVDTFLISIISPHLYLQSSAVEQGRAWEGGHRSNMILPPSTAILFWLNCKSVYSYWQNEKKLLNAEVSIQFGLLMCCHGDLCR